MKADYYRALTLRNEDDCGELKVYRDNRGEPYRKGVTLAFDCDGTSVHVFLETGEVQRLRDFLNEGTK